MNTIEQDPAEIISARTFILNLSIGALRTRASVTKERVEKMAQALMVEEPTTVAEMATADSDDLTVSKELFRVEEIRALKAEMAGIRNLIRSKAQPVRFLKGGLYLYAATRVEWAETQIAASQDKIDSLLAALEPRYAEIIEEDRVRLEPRGLFDLRDYPTLAVIREKSRVRYSWLQFGVPEGLKNISKIVFEAEREKAKQLWRETFAEIRLAYATTLTDAVEKLRACLVPGEDGKTRVLKQAGLDRMMEFFSTFRVQDVTGFEELAALADKARDVMRGLDAEVLRTEEKAASRVAAAMEQIGETLVPLVMEQQRRVQLRD